MKKSNVIYVIISILLPVICFSQTLSLQDNWQIPEDTIITISSANYSFSDSTKDGVIQIVNKNNITIDGNGAAVDGNVKLGYMIYINNSNNIVVKNFASVKNYYYAVYVKNSQNIKITNCNFSYNKIDSTGWIVIFDGADKALGGGVFMDSCKTSIVDSNTMQYQNDGIALYNSNNITVQNNNFSWNTSYGVRMYYSDSSYIFYNNCSHINRITDPSDCAAILMMSCSENQIEYNDFTYSGDGIFINDNGTFTPGNNYFAYNDCSYSPHNAVESVFSSGNVFKNNKANYSNYGFWLGYSYNTVVDSNEIHHNSGIDADGGGGIAIDRGYNNTITYNSIKNNSNGVKVWKKGSPIPPYSNTSHDYVIENNVFYGNQTAIYSLATEKLGVKQNSFSSNYSDLYISGAATNDTITYCAFSNTAGFYIENKSSNNIYAAYNTFPNDTNLISCKIFDKIDTSTSGEVYWNPFLVGSNITFEKDPPSDLAEKPAVWDAYYYVEDAASTSIMWDSTDKKNGNEALFIDTKSGWDVILHYFPANNTIASWQLREADSLSLWMKCIITDPDNPWGIQESFIRIGNNCGGYYQYTNDYFQNVNPHIVNDCINQWKVFKIPLAGDSTWIRNTSGDMSFADINYIEINVDVWEYGYKLWVDGLSIPFIPAGEKKIQKISKNTDFDCFPNPSNDSFTILFDNHENKPYTLRIYNSIGQKIQQIEKIKENQQIINSRNLETGIYLLQLLQDNEIVGQRKLIKQ